MTVVKLDGGMLDSTANYGIGEFWEKQGYQFEETDITVDANTTWTTGTDWVDVRGASIVQILCSFTGANAGSSGNVTFGFVAKPDNAATFDTPTTASFSVVGALNANTEVVKDALANTEAYGYIKLLSIINGDATYALADVNVELWYKTKAMY